MSTPEEVLAGTAPFAVVCGDATEVLKSLPADAFHVCYCDPPYGLSSQDTNDVVACLTAWLSGKVYTHSGTGFMGKEWDAFVPGPEAWREVYRVLKPGAYCVAFSATRTVDLLGVAMRLAGLEVRNGWAWVFGQGFPKSLDVSKAIAKRAGGAVRAREAIAWVKEERERQGLSRNDLETRIFGRCDGNVRNWEDGISIPRPGLWTSIRDALGHASSPFDVDMERGDDVVSVEDGNYGYQPSGERWRESREIREPTTDLAKQWEGYGTDTKPAYEPLVVTRKPLDGTVASNVLAHGCGALNIDGARIQHTTVNGGNLADNPHLLDTIKQGAQVAPSAYVIRKEDSESSVHPAGRFPSNLALVHDEGCVRVGTVKVRGGNDPRRADGTRSPSTTFGLNEHSGNHAGYADPDGTGTVDEWQCTETCAVAELGRQGAAAGVHGAGSARGGGLGTEGRKSMFIPNGETNGSRYGDTGTAARFFYQAKASAKDRLAYLTCDPTCTGHNTVAPAKDASEKVCPVCKSPRTVYLHPTVKPYELALHHAKLLSLPPHVQPVAVVPFCGTGIEARALLDAGFRVIAIDIDPRHVAMTTYRLSGEQPVREEPVPRETPAPVTAPLTLDDLFGF